MIDFFILIAAAFSFIVMAMGIGALSEKITKYQEELQKKQDTADFLKQGVASGILDKGALSTAFEKLQQYDEDSGRKGIYAPHNNGNVGTSGTANANGNQSNGSGNVYAHGTGHVFERGESGSSTGTPGNYSINAGNIAGHVTNNISGGVGSEKTISESKIIYGHNQISGCPSPCPPTGDNGKTGGASEKPKGDRNWLLDALKLNKKAGTTYKKHAVTTEPPQVTGRTVFDGPKLLQKGLKYTEIGGTSGGEKPVITGGSPLKQITKQITSDDVHRPTDITPPNQGKNRIVEIGKPIINIKGYVVPEGDNELPAGKPPLLPNPGAICLPGDTTKPTNGIGRYVSEFGKPPEEKRRATTAIRFGSKTDDIKSTSEVNQSRYIPWSTQVTKDRNKRATKVEETAEKQVPGSTGEESTLLTNSGKSPYGKREVTAKYIPDFFKHIEPTKQSTGTTKPTNGIGRYVSEFGKPPEEKRRATTAIRFGSKTDDIKSTSEVNQSRYIPWSTELTKKRNADKLEAKKIAEKQATYKPMFSKIGLSAGEKLLRAAKAEETAEKQTTYKSGSVGADFKKEQNVLAGLNRIMAEADKSTEDIIREGKQSSYIPWGTELTKKRNADKLEAKKIAEKQATYKPMFNTAGKVVESYMDGLLNGQTDAGSEAPIATPKPPSSGGLFNPFKRKHMQILGGGGRKSRSKRRKTKNNLMNPKRKK